VAVRGRFITHQAVWFVQTAFCILSLGSVSGIAFDRLPRARGLGGVPAPIAGVPR
jgi:hypothetical protein